MSETKEEVDIDEEQKELTLYKLLGVKQDALESDIVSSRGTKPNRKSLTGSSL